MEEPCRRLPWEEVDRGVREHVERVVGAPVVAARNEPGGYGPGLAARCRLADGRGVFVKAVSPDQNPVTPQMLRREIEVTAALPAGAPAPALLDAYDDGYWVAAVFEEVDGVNPPLPWHPDDLDRVVRAVDDLATAAGPFPVAGLRTVHAALDDDFRGWRRLAGGPRPDDLDPWCARHLEHLAELEEAWAGASAGTALVHLDVRADNVLLTVGGTVVFVDWAHASVGAPWIDVVTMAPAVTLHGGPPCEDVLRRSGPASRADEGAVTAFVAGLGGYFTFQSRQPPPPGLPTVRRFQADQAGVTVDWLRRRTGWR